MDMGMTLAAMAGRWTAPLALREASPPTQLQSLRYGRGLNPSLPYTYTISPPHP